MFETALQKPEAASKCCGFPSPETSETQRLIMMGSLLEGLLTGPARLPSWKDPNSPASPVNGVESLVTASE